MIYIKSIVIFCGNTNDNQRNFMGRYIIVIILILTSQSIDNISSRLVCQCGCGYILSNCPHENCPSAIPMRESISKALKDGKSENTAGRRTANG